MIIYNQTENRSLNAIKREDVFPESPY